MGLAEIPFYLQADAPSGPPPSDQILLPEPHVAEFCEKSVPRPDRKFKEMLDRASSPEGLQNSTDYQVYEAYGIPHVGKSTFVDQMEAICQDRKIPLARRAFYFYDKGGNQEQHEHVLLNSMIGSIAKKLAQQGIEFPEFDTRMQEFKSLATPKYIHRLGTAFFQQLYAVFTQELANSDRPVVLALERIDKSSSMFQKFHDNVMKPLVARDGNRVVFIVTGIQPMDWHHQPDAVRRAVYQDELGVFDTAMMAQQLELYRKGWGKFAPEIYEITHGYPAATRMVCGLLASIEPSHGEVNADLITSQKVHLLTRVIEDLIDNTVLRPNFPPKGRERLVKAFHLAAVAGRFNADLIHKLLSKFVPGYQTLSEPVFPNIIGYFSSTGLVKWDTSYYIDPVIATTYDTQLRLANRDRYRQVHEWLIEYYNEIIKGTSDEAKRARALQHLEAHQQALQSLQS
jgi:hypothetical protein